MQIREAVGSRESLALGLAGLGGVLALWLMMTAGAVERRFVSPLILPSPLEVLGAFPILHFERGLNLSVMVSLKRVTLGFLLAVATALPLGVAMATQGWLRSVLQPLTTALGYVPVPALIPLTISWFGIDETQKIVFLAISIFIALLPLVIAAIDDVDEVFLQTGYTLGANRWHTVRYVLLPIAAPSIWQGFRTLYGLGWSLIILAEVVGAESGVGFLIQSAQRRSHMDQVYALLLVIVTVAIVIDLGFRLAGRFLFPHEEGKAT